MGRKAAPRQARLTHQGLATRQPVCQASRWHISSIYVDKFSRPIGADFETSEEIEQRLTVLCGIRANPQGRLQRQGYPPRQQPGESPPGWQAGHRFRAFQHAVASLARCRTPAATCQVWSCQNCCRRRRMRPFSTALRARQPRLSCSANSNACCSESSAALYTRRRHACVPGLLTGQEALRAAYHLQGGLVRRLAEMQGGEHTDAGLPSAAVLASPDDRSR